MFPRNVRASSVCYPLLEDVCRKAAAYLQGAKQREGLPRWLRQ